MLLHIHSVHFYTVILIHLDITKDCIGDLCFLSGCDRDIPFRLSVILPNVRLDFIEIISFLLPDNVRKLEGLFIHHTVRAVDNGCLYSVILTEDKGGNELQFYPQLIIQLSEHCPAAEFRVMDDVGIAEHRAHFLFIEIHGAPSLED